MAEIGFLPGIVLVLWIYLPGFLVNTFAMMWGKWLPKTGYGPWPIDNGRNWKDGNRILGDGKTWNGLIGGSLTSGLLCILMVAMVRGSDEGIFRDPMAGASDAWFAIGGIWTGAFILGTLLGFTSLLGDLTGSFIKRRQGHKREGNVSSKAPLLDTLPFAISVFAFGQIFLIGSLHADHSLLPSIVLLLILTPLIHRLFNILGYKLGWKDVPY